jgi:hypothetical protein
MQTLTGAEAFLSRRWVSEEDMETTILLGALAFLACGMIAGTAVVVTKDGHGRRPERAGYDTRNPS